MHLLTYLARFANFYYFLLIIFICNIKCSLKQKLFGGFFQILDSLISRSSIYIIYTYIWCLSYMIINIYIFLFKLMATLNGRLFNNSTLNKRNEYYSQIYYKAWEQSEGCCVSISRDNLKGTYSVQKFCRLAAFAGQSYIKKPHNENKIIRRRRALVFTQEIF